MPSFLVGLSPDARYDPRVLDARKRKIEADWNLALMAPREGPVSQNKARWLKAKANLRRVAADARDDEEIARAILQIVKTDVRRLKSSYHAAADSHGSLDRDGIMEWLPTFGLPMDITPAAAGETFNVTNGDVFAWPNVWPALADAFGMDAGEPAPMSLADYLPARAELWAQIAERHGLRHRDLAAMLGESHHYADFCLAHGASRPPPPVLVSTIKLRQAGFAGCIDTEAMFRELIRQAQDAKLLPPR